jgi:hypothetical protein
MTPAEQQKILRLKKEVTPMERVEAESGLTAWENSIQRADKSLSKKQCKLTNDSTSKSLHSLPSVSKSKNIPPVRGTGSGSAADQKKVDKAGQKRNQSSLDDEDVANNIRLSGECSRLPTFSKINILRSIQQDCVYNHRTHY